MSAQGPGRKRIPNRDKLSAEDDALNQIVREAEARLAAKRAARAEAREIRMKELEKREKELFHSHKRYYGLDNKWGHIEQWMEDSERYSRHSRRLASVSDDEEKMSVGSRGSFRPSDYSSFLSSSSRASSRASSARASPVVEERPDRDFVDKSSRTASTLSAATLASLGGTSSRRGSCDTSLSVETEASIREIKDSLVEAEEKYRKAMVSNAQLHNEKMALMYQVETLREELNDMEELLWEARRQCDVTTKEFERERQAHVFIQFQFKEMKETLRQSDELLKEVSELRVRNRTYCQEVCDLQETLQWKDKRIVALERQKEISDVVCVQQDQLRNEVTQLRNLLKKHGIVLPDITPNGESEKSMAEDDVSDESGSRLSQEASHGGRESMLGNTPTQHPAEGPKYPQDETKSVNMITNSDRETGASSVGMPLLGNFTSRTKQTQQGSAAAMVPAGSQALREGSKHDTSAEKDETDDEKKIMKQTSGDVFNGEDCMEQSEAEDHKGQSPKVGDLSKEEMEKSAGQSLHSTQTQSFSCHDVCDVSISSEHDPSLPSESNAVGERPSSHEEVKKQRIPEEESPLFQKTNPDSAFENLNEMQTPQSSAVPQFIPRGALKDWTGVEKMVQSILRQFLQNQSFVAEMRKLVPELTGSLNWWISEGEDMEKTTPAQVLDQQGPADKPKPLADGVQTQDPEDGIDADPSDSGSRVKTILHLEEHDDRGAAGRTSEVTSRTSASKQQETFVEPEDDQSDDPDPTVYCCCQDLVFVESYFAEPFESRAEDCGSDQDSVDHEVEPEKPAGSPTEDLRDKKHQIKFCLHHRSKVRPFAEEETVEGVEIVTDIEDIQVFPVKNRKQKKECDIL